MSKVFEHFQQNVENLLKNFRHSYSNGTDNSSQPYFLSTHEKVPRMRDLHIVYVFG